MLLKDSSDTPLISKWRVDPDRLGYFQDRLLTWYQVHGRDLPWRHTRDPYHILVSEVMLHQTQVSRVLPKYLEFLSVYPTFQALADAPLAEVIQLWYPLGYNFRPRRLHTIAQKVMKDFDGKLPDTVEGLMEFPGIGRYTAGAILSFAFHKDAPIVDTNVRRVLRRSFGVQGEPFRAATNRVLWQLAAEVIPPGKGYLFNQALMDFGALVCVARNPRCEQCFFRDCCHHFGLQTRLE